jgi:hypothetical protein
MKVAGGAVEPLPAGQVGEACDRAEREHRRGNEQE